MSNNKIPTVDKFFKEEFKILAEEAPAICYDFKLKAIAYTKLHVEAALKAAADRAEIEWDLADVAYVKQESILNAYPLTNIK